MTAKIKFSGISDSSEGDSSRQEEMIEKAQDKLGKKSAIVEQLEKVSGLTQTIKAAGDAMSEVS